MITYGSVCSGIEAATVAMEAAGWKASWFAEIEPFPCQVLKHHYPDTPNLGDMTKIAAMVRVGEVAAPDVLVGGTPCQAFSVAGLRQGLQDQRGQLTLSFVELANEIDAARSVRGHAPCIVWWENVPGVLSSKDNAFGCFLGALAGEDGELQPPGKKWPNAGCVFGPERAVAWRVLDAQYFGVAQRRRRVFVVASARNGFHPAAVLFEFDGLRRDIAPSRKKAEEVASTVTAGASNGGRSHGARSGSAKDNLIVPVIGNPPVIMAHGQGGAEISVDRCPTLTCNHEAPIAFKEEPYTLALRGRGNSPNFEFRQDGLANALLTPNGGRGGIGVGAVCVTGEITHTLVGEGFDASEDGTGRGQPIIPAYAFAQNTRDEVRFLGGDGEIAGALAAQPGMKQTTYVVPGGMQVRRLTPRECERLQGFPDDYTLIPCGRTVRMEKLETDWVKYLLRGGVMTLEEVCRAAADGPRYKALGNSMAVPCMRWIGLRIAAQIAQAQELEAA